jgi:hypothetical protein
MTRKQFLALIVVLVVLAAAGAWIMWSQRTDWESTDTRVGQRLLPGLIVANVGQIRIQEPGHSVTLERKDDGWHVKERMGYPAHVERICEMLVKLAGLKVVQVEPLGEKQRPRLDLVEPGAADAKNAGTLVELKNRDGKPVGRLLLGKKVVRQTSTTAPTKGAPEPTGRYVVAGDKNAVAVVGDPLSNIQADPASWLARDLVRVRNAIAMTSLTGEGRLRWKATRANENADWKSADRSQPLDSNKLQDLVSVLFYVALADVATEPSKADFENGVTLKVDTQDNYHYVFKLGSQAGDLRYFHVALTGDPPVTRTPGKDESAEDKAKKDKEYVENRKGMLGQIEREGRLKDWTFLVKNADVEALLRDRSQLQPEKKKDAKAK